jgi:hypothetical protein
MRLLAAIGMLAVLSGCGEDKQGAEDFTVEVRKSPSEVADAIAHLDFGAEQAAFSGLVITASRPSRDEIVYTMPARDLPDRSVGESVIRLTLEPIRGGSATTIHAAVDVPPVRMLMGEANKELSERKVERELRKVLAALSANDLKDLLVAVAVSSNTDLQSQYNTAQLESENPEAIGWGHKKEARGERSRWDSAALDDSRGDGAATSDWGAGTPD